MRVTDAELNEDGIRLGDLLQQKGLMMVTAESCTGGWVAKVLTDRAGSSAYVTGGLVTYSNEAKQALLGVSAETLAEHGAVSEPVVREMVAGALKASGADVAVAVSGIAGPGGATEGKPVGTVWFAWGRAGGAVEAQLAHFDGDRELVRRQSVGFSLNGVRQFLEQQ